MELKTVEVKTKDCIIKNDIEKRKLTVTRKNKKIVYHNFCICAIDGNIVTLKQANCIMQTRTDDPRIKKILPILLAPPKPRKKKTTTKKTSKTTIKGKRENDGTK